MTLSQISTAIKAVLKPKQSSKSAESPKNKRCARPQKTFIQHSSQVHFKNRDQTAVVFDFDDTLFPTTFLEHESGLCSKSQADQQPHIGEDELNNALEKIEQCQVAAEALLRCAQNFGRVIIVTLSSRSLLKKRCEAWYPRVWTQMKDPRITIVYAIESHKASLTPAQSKQDMSEFSTSHWAWVKGKAIAQALDGVYSQYKGQTWKNVISIGDSNFERYGTLGAASAYVQRKILRTNTPEGAAYVQGWEKFDNKLDWTEDLEGVHEGRVFKVRTKVLKLMDAPSPTDLAQELTLLLDWFPSIVWLDGCLNHHFTNMNEETVKSFESALEAADATEAVESDIDEFDM